MTLTNILTRLQRAWAALTYSRPTPTEKTIMATLSEVQASLSTLGSNVTALLAKQDANTESTDLDTIKASVDDLNTQVVSALGTAPSDPSAAQ